MTAKPVSWTTDPVERLARKNAFDASLTVGTAKFNRDTGRENLRPPFSQFIDPATGLIRADMLRPRNCPICGAAPGPGLFVKDGFRHVRCLECDLIYVSLILREDLMIQHWREEMAWTMVLKSQPQAELDRLKYDYGLDLASERLASRRLLDVGAGTGDFARRATERGWEATALELNVESTNALARQGYKVIVKPLEMADLADGTFDLVSLWEVLEHVAEPKTTLAETRRVLADDGLALILVPNSASLVTRLLHEKSNTFGGHSHLNHFNPKSLTLLLESLRFEIVELETVITELGSVNNHLHFQDPYLGEAPAFFPDLTPEVIHRNLWGSRLLALVRPGAKPGPRRGARPEANAAADLPESAEPEAAEGQDAEPRLARPRPGGRRKKS
ncbi:MAG: class I SAM-dependent methyltransferase [Deltaproteobacteria bacterium]|jgi:2-polyprenyl-3-methyl-5-hydroxy-6-metoxy-1,4-benzoquinol methylase|nr:class I SAM-dependent methyltransferase [Deltaproteobacteria bacterium]